MSPYTIAWILYILAVVLGGAVLRSWLPQSRVWTAVIVVCGIFLITPWRALEDNTTWLAPALWIALFDETLRLGNASRSLYPIWMAALILGVLAIALQIAYWIYQWKKKKADKRKLTITE